MTKSVAGSSNDIPQLEPPEVSSHSTAPGSSLVHAHSSIGIIKEIDYVDVDNYDVGWIDGCQLHRDCIPSFLSGIHPAYNMVPFASAEDCIVEGGAGLSLIVYYSHGQNKRCLDDIAMLRQAFAAVRLIIFSDADDMNTSNTIRSALDGGADGFVSTTNTSLHMALAALHFVRTGGTLAPLELLINEQPSEWSSIHSEEKAPYPDDAPHIAQLTNRQMDVLTLLRQGKPNKIIAYDLGLSISTVKVHIRAIMRKLGASNRTHAATKALRLELASDDIQITSDCEPSSDSVATWETPYSADSTDNDHIDG